MTGICMSISAASKSFSCTMRTAISPFSAKSTRIRGIFQQVDLPDARSALELREVPHGGGGASPVPLGTVMGRETHHTNGIAFLYETAVTAESLCGGHPCSAAPPTHTDPKITSPRFDAASLPPPLARLE
jgi:hypothetical protein